MPEHKVFNPVLPQRLIDKMEPVVLTDDQGSFDAAKFGGWYMHKTERHFPKPMMAKPMGTPKGRIPYQWGKIKKIPGWIPEHRRRCAVDVGSHIGFWAYYLVDWFDEVAGYEPHPVSYRLQKFNMAECPNYTGHNLGLGDSDGTMWLYTNWQSNGSSFVSSESEDVIYKNYPDHKRSEKPVLIIKLDDHWPSEKVIDLVKLDLEGYEEIALKGMAQLLTRYKPYIIVEQKLQRAWTPEYEHLQHRGAVDYLISEHGYREVQVHAGDYFLAHPEG